MTIDHVIRQAAQFILLAARCEELESAHANVARGNTRQHRAREHALAIDRLAGDHRGKSARRWNAERMHRLAHQIFAQDRAESCPPVTVAREGRTAGALELNVAAMSVALDQFAEQQRAAVAQLRHEAAELMPGIYLRQRRGAVRSHIAAKDSRAFG